MGGDKKKKQKQKRHAVLAISDRQVHVQIIPSVSGSYSICYAETYLFLGSVMTLDFLKKVLEFTNVSEKEKETEHDSRVKPQSSEQEVRSSDVRLPEGC